jgi:Tol biopolymer transport system component
MSVSDTGTIVFRSVTGDDVGMWKADRDGRHGEQLLAGSIAFPKVSADGQQIVFSSPASGEQSVWRLATAGGEASQIVPDTLGLSSFSGISPDGKSIVLFLGRSWTICDFPACADRRQIPLPGQRVIWTPDGRSLTYLDGPGRNLWMFPLDGGPPRPLTHFDDGRVINGFAWSNDGQRLALTLASASSDIVLFSGLQSRR